MHEVLRQYANEELRALPQEHQQALAGQCEHCTGWLAERTPLLFGAEQLDALQKVGEESENLRAAWRWALEQGDLAAMNSLLDGLARFFEMRARFEEGEALMEQAVERLQALGAPGDPLRGRLLMYQGRLSLQCGINIKETQTRLEGAQRLLPATSFPKESIFIQSHLGEAGRVLGDMQAAATALERALTLVETTEAPAETAMAQNYYGILQATQGKLAVAREHFEAGIGCLLPMGDAWGTLKVRSNLGNVLAMLKEFDVARQNMEELLELVRVFDSHGLHATILGNLGTLMYDTGEYSKAGPYYLDSLRIARQYGMVWIEGNALVNLADLHLLEKQWTRARDRYLEGLRIAEAHQNFQLAILGVTGLAQLAIAQGDLSLAAQLLAYVREHPANCGSLEERYEETLQQFRNCSTNGFDALPEAPGSLQEALPELYALAA
jgi:tetratricopeptide (TPR) repeat protein